VYAALRQLGRRGVAELIEGCCDHAQTFATQLTGQPGVELLCPVELNQVLVRFLDARSTAPAAHDARTREVIRRVQEAGVCYMSETTWHGMVAMRISVSNWSTDAEDVTQSVASIALASRDQ
jgi:glutamate/tyrosine decarboxylase-like PLP-dependent enzyme